MGNLIELPNINPEAIVIDGNNSKKAKKNSNFSLKNYLDTRVPEGEKERSTTIRLLPMNLETGEPFVKIHVHNVKVPQELVKDGGRPYKDYICLAKTSDIDHEKFGHKCPFCEINKSAYEKSLETTDPVEKKDWQTISIGNKSKEAVILRCIERGKEDEGVKFWKFKLRDDKTDPWNQIRKLYQLRKEEGERAGQEINILDIYNGRDLTVTFAADGTSAPQILDASISTPLSKDEEQMRAWIYDPKKWNDVFTCKTYDYLKLVSEMRVPWYDKDNGVWVDKEDFEEKHGRVTTDADKAAKDASAEMKRMAAEVKTAPAHTSSPAAEPKEETKPSFAASITIDGEDDLPF